MAPAGMQRDTQIGKAVAGHSGDIVRGIIQPLRSQSQMAQPVLLGQGQDRVTLGAHGLRREQIEGHRIGTPWCLAFSSGSTWMVITR